MSSKSLDDLHPDLKPMCAKHLALCSAAGIDARVIFTYRTPADQDRIYSQGRTTPGAVVTMLKGSASKHCFTIDGKPAAKAYDIAIYDAGRYITDGTHRLYKLAGELGESIGMQWGGRWKKPFDPSHFQI